MSFQSIRKFVSVHKGRKRNEAMLSINVISNGELKNGEKSYSISIIAHPDLLEQMKWDDKTRVDVLVDEENQLCMLKKDPLGFAITLNPNGFATIKFRLNNSFAYIPKDSDRLSLTILEFKSCDFLVFEMPKIDHEYPDAPIAAAMA